MALDEEQKKQLMLIGGGGIALVAIIFIVKSRKGSSTQPDVSAPVYSMLPASGSGIIGNPGPNPSPNPAPGPHPTPNPTPGGECPPGFHRNDAGQCVPGPGPMPNPDPGHNCPPGFYWDGNKCTPNHAPPPGPPGGGEGGPPVAVGSGQLVSLSTIVNNMAGTGKGGGTPSAVQSDPTEIARTEVWNLRGMYLGDY